KGTEVRFFLDLAHLFDTQHAFRSDDKSNVRMIRPDYLCPFVSVITLRIVQLYDPNTRRANATRFMILRRSAIQSARDFECKALLADAFFACEQHRAGKPVSNQHSFQRRFDTRVSGEFVKHTSWPDGLCFGDTG